MYKRNILHAQSMQITQNTKFKMYPFGLCIDFSVSQSIDESIWRVHGTCCMSLRQFYTPPERNTVHLYTVNILFFSAAVRTISGTMGLWKFCNYVIQEFACIPWRLVRVSQNIHIHCTQKKYLMRIFSRNRLTDGPYITRNKLTDGPYIRTSYQ